MEAENMVSWALLLSSIVKQREVFPNEEESKVIEFIRQGGCNQLYLAIRDGNEAPLHIAIQSEKMVGWEDSCAISNAICDIRPTTSAYCLLKSLCIAVSSIAKTHEGLKALKDAQIYETLDSLVKYWIILFCCGCNHSSLYYEVSLTLFSLSYFNSVGCRNIRLFGPLTSE